jgi:Spy/CpxP family protein refolding chaperone
METLLKASLLILGLSAAALPVLQAADTTASAPTEKHHPKLRALLKHRAAIRKAVARRLDLTAEQKAQMKANREKTVATLKALRADPNLTREQKRAQARQTLEAARAEMRNVLTPEQQAKLKDMREKVKARREKKV